MRIIAVGDVVGNIGVEHLEKELWSVRNDNKIDFCIVNGENASEISGLNRNDANRIFDAGADIITLGNHTWGRKDLYEFLDQNENIIRPANFFAGLPGSGYTVARVGGYKILCINLIGTVYMEAESSPFHAVDKILNSEKGNYDFAIVDFHAETTSEKIAMGRYLDGRASIVFGTHTHVQTADEKIFPGGTAYITDLGMTGPENSVLGVCPEIIIRRFLTHMPERFIVADGEVEGHGIIVDIDESSGKAKAIKRIVF
jgi:metallophosphoesterase (TIGR00282 family)